MGVARHPRPPELEGVPIETIMARYVGRFREKKPVRKSFGIRRLLCCLPRP